MLQRPFGPSAREGLLSAMACSVCRREKVGLSNRVSLAILRLVFQSSLSDARNLAFVNCLLKALAMSVSEEIVFDSN